MPAPSDGVPREGRLAGVDYGHVRIGIAVSDLQQVIASPLEIYTRRSQEEDARYFECLRDQEQLVGFVVGLPIHTSGHESAKSIEARRFGGWLADITQRPVTYYDERYSTAAAESILDEAGLTSRQRKRRRDMLAAQIILSGFLESWRLTDDPGPLDDAP